MTTAYEEARSRLAAFESGPVFVVTARNIDGLRKDIRALLAGPPEPSEEDVAVCVYASVHHLMRVGGGVAQDAYNAAARAVQALYRKP